MTSGLTTKPPIVIVIAGPNGAGKTTIAKRVLADTLGLVEFVNADVIAAGLSGFAPDRSALTAGRIMLGRLRELASSRASFAFESTLASRTFAPWLSELCTGGYEFHLVYVYLASPALAVERVEARVRKGGHDVPSDVVRRRYVRSLSNLFSLYVPLARTWRILDNSGRRPRLVAAKVATGSTVTRNATTFRRIQSLSQ